MDGYSPLLLPTGILLEADAFSLIVRIELEFAERIRHHLVLVGLEAVLLVVIGIGEVDLGLVRVGTLDEEVGEGRNFLALVLFKHRGLQIRVAVIACLLLLGFQIWLGFKYFNSPDGVVFKFTAILPLIASALDALAIRGIMADELLVESYGRLRTKKKNRKK
jgi:hypothetical protein